MRLNLTLSRNGRRRFRLLLLFFFWGCSALVYGQQQKVTLSGSNGITLKEAFNQIEKQTGLSVDYNVETLDDNCRLKPIPVAPTVDKLMNLLLKEIDCQYVFRDGHIIISKQGNQEVRKVSGRIVDVNGEPIIGANVLEKGTSNGTITDIDGKFSFEVSSTAILQVTYIGYNSIELQIGKDSVAEVVMKEDSETLKEVVVVGYGVQKKVNVVGSISQVDSKALQNRSTPQLSNALSGQMAGVTVIQRSGQPGESGGEVRIRGVGSFGATPSALVLIDGVPGDMNEINMEDVETISVLKDASTAAIYGARAANGVVLITTKSGKASKVSVSYNGYVGTTIATALPEFVDSWEYCTLINEARGTEVYSPEDIEAYRYGKGDPNKYGNAKYLDEVFSRNGFQTGHTVSINGGNEKNRYLTSFGYLSQLGLVEKNDYSKYNLRMNVTNQLLPNLKLATRLSGVYGIVNEPAVPGGDDQQSMLGIIAKAIRMPGLTPSILSDGSFALGNELHGTPPGWIQSESFYYKKNYRFNANVSLNYSPIKDLQFMMMGAYDNKSIEDKRYRSTQKLTDGRIMGPSSLSQEHQRAIYKTFQFTAQYNKLIKLHDFNLLLGYSWEQEDYENLRGFRDKFPGNDLPFINAGSPSNQQSKGGAYGWALQSYFGRLQYNYAERYLFESTVRYDGSSKFAPGNRFGLFPSVAVGWRISEEDFFKDVKQLSWVSSLKLKASWGRLGNQNITDNYPYQSVYNLEYPYPFGGTLNQGGAILTAVDPSIKWEETETIDAGIESVLFDGLLRFNASYFYRSTYDILYKPTNSVSTVLGKNIAVMNVGKLKNTGWEFEIGHDNTVGEFKYGVNANFSIILNKVTSLGVGNIKQPNGLVGDGSSLFIGHPIQLYYGYKTDGVFINEAEIGEWADMSAVNPKPQPGDIRYVDVSGPNGVPDGKVDPNYDRVPLGSRIPKYTFGLNLDFEYKNFDFSALIQGVAGVKGYLNGYAGFALANQSNIQRWQADGRFRQDNPVRYPDYPRIEDMGNSTPPNYQMSDFWVLDASYIRLKNVQLGYKIPRKFLNKYGIENLRFYVQAENPLSIHGYRKGWDPEINTGGSYYPILATYTFGINLKF